MKLAWTRAAAADRRLIRQHISQDQPLAALALDELFSSKAVRLLDHPSLGRPGRVPGTRELVVHRHYLLIYVVTDDQILVLRVVHTARLWP